MTILKNIVITKVFQKDIPKLKIVLQENIPEEDEVKLILSYLKGLKDRDGRIRKYFLAKSKTGKILGCMAYAKPDSDLKKYFKVYSKNSVELLNCFVSKKYQGYGVGTNLFLKICDEIKKQNVEKLLVQSGPWYKTSWKFYDKVFDKCIGNFIGKYDGIADAKVWMKFLR